MSLEKQSRSMASQPANHLSGAKPKASHNNTKAVVKTSLPTGKDHSKIIESKPPM